MSDLIEREDAIKLFLERKNELAGIQGDLGGAMSGAEKLIESLPSAEPKQGRWVETIVRGSTALYCSNCEQDSGSLYRYNYCPHCGAEMEVAE